MLATLNKSRVCLPYRRLPPRAYQKNASQGKTPGPPVGVGKTAIASITELDVIELNQVKAIKSSIERGRLRLNWWFLRAPTLQQSRLNTRLIRLHLSSCAISSELLLFKIMWVESFWLYKCPYYYSLNISITHIHYCPVSPAKQTVVKEQSSRSRCEKAKVIWPLSKLSPVTFSTWWTHVTWLITLI